MARRTPLPPIPEELEGWARMFAGHIRQFRPKMYREMCLKGILVEMSRATEQAALDYRQALVKAGIPPQEALLMAEREVIRGLWSEKDDPNMERPPVPF